MLATVDSRGAVEGLHVKQGESNVRGPHQLDAGWPKHGTPAIPGSRRRSNAVKQEIEFLERHLADAE